MALCKVCQVIDESLFYPSIKTYCKDHWKERVRANRIANIEHYKLFDKMRASKPHRVKLRSVSRQRPKRNVLRKCQVLEPLYRMVGYLPVM